MNFKTYLLTQTLNECLKKINENSSMSQAFLGSGDSLPKLIKALKKENEDLTTAFCIKGVLPTGEQWFFVYKEIKELSKETIFKTFEKMFKDYSIGTGTNNFTRITLLDIKK